jgi:transposase
MSEGRKSYPRDVTDPEWEFLLPYRTLMREDGPPREHLLRDVFDALRYVVKTGCRWDVLPHDFPPWATVYQQARRWIAAGAFEDITHDLRMILRMVDEREGQPTAAIRDGRTVPSTPESGAGPGSTGPRRRRGPRSTSRWTRWGTCWRGR